VFFRSELINPLFLELLGNENLYSKTKNTSNGGLNSLEFGRIQENKLFEITHITKLEDSD
jgi:hypothetical protein